MPRWQALERFRNPPPLVTVIRLAGVIGQFGPMRGGLTLAATAPAIERAFAPRRLAAVALAVNSPGGAPVQASLIAARIRQRAAEREVPVIAFAEDVAASGGYWLALAADEIFADDSSILGSIGVVSAGFGFHGLLERIGVERRLHAKGERKAMLDPFRPENPRDVERLDAIQTDIHQAFQDFVRARRGDKLKAPEAELFNGDIWAGRQAAALGLIDGIGEMRAVMRERFGDKVRLRPVTTQRRWLRRKLGLASHGPGGWADELLAAAHERALWSRYGL